MNLSLTIANGVAVAMAMYPQLRGRFIDYAAWSVNWTPIAASATEQNGDIVFGQEADILILAATRVVTAVDNTTFLANVPMIAMLRDISSGVNITNIKTAVDDIFGTAQNPMVWPWPKLFYASSTLSTILDNLAATAYNVKITYHGVRVYPQAPKYRGQKLLGAPVT